MSDTEVTAIPAQSAPAEVSVAPNPTASPVAAPATVAATPENTAASPAPSPALADAATNATGSPEPVVEKPSLLGTETEAKPEVKTDAKTEVKVEAKPETEVKPTDAKPEGDKPAETKEGDTPAIPTYEPFKLPEGVKVDEKIMGEFTGLLGQLENAKGDHKSTQEVGQKLTDLFTANMQAALKNQQDYYVQLHNQKVNNWVDDLQKDPILGKGDAKVLQKTATDMANFIARNGGAKEHVTEFRKIMTESGVGNAPAVVHVFKSLMSKIEGYENETSQMLPGTKPQSAKTHPGQGIIKTLYGSGSK